MTISATIHASGVFFPQDLGRRRYHDLQDIRE